MLEIRTDISTLSKDQREQLAGFILTFDMPRQLPLKYESAVAEGSMGAEAEKAMLGSFELKMEEIKELVYREPSPEEVFGTVQPEIRANHVSLNEDGSLTTAYTVPPPPPPTISTAGPHLVVGSVSVDKNGLPWDERIHSSSKALTDAGLWRKKRGVDPAAVAFAESELRAIPTGTPAPPPPPPTAPSPATADGKALYVKLIQATASAIGSKRFTTEEFKAIAVAHGVPSIPLLINNLDKVQAVSDECLALIASRG
jgi:hypothetical protein